MCIFAIVILVLGGIIDHFLLDCGRGLRSWNWLSSRCCTSLAAMFVIAISVRPSVNAEAKECSDSQVRKEFIVEILRFRHFGGWDLLCVMAGEQGKSRKPVCQFADANRSSLIADLAIGRCRRAQKSTNCSSKGRLYGDPAKKRR